MPRTLTEDQKTAIATAIGSSGNLLLVIDATVEDANAYAMELAEVFTAAGWGVETQSLATPWGATPTGLAFMTEGDLPVREVGQDLMAAFTATEVPFNQLDALLPEDCSVKLLVGRVGV